MTKDETRGRGNRDEQRDVGDVMEIEWTWDRCCILKPSGSESNIRVAKSETE